MNTCTGSAKVAHIKSSTYGAKFELMCKSLQQVSQYIGINEREKNRTNQASSVLKSMKKQENLNLGERAGFTSGQRIGG